MNNLQTQYAECPGKLARFLIWVSWGYPFLVVVVWMLAALWGDSWWPATLILYAPRWFALMPLVILLPVAVISNRLLLIPLLAGGLIVAGPFMGFRFPSHKTTTAAPIVRVLTCNVDMGRFNRQALIDLLRKTDADIVALQECPRDLGVSLPEGWQSMREGELMIWSRYPLHRGKILQALHPPHVWPRACLLTCTVQTPQGALTFCTVHLPSPRYGLTAVLDRKTILNLSRSGLLEQETWHRQRTAREVVREITTLPGPLVIAGDFNMPADSPLYRKAWGGYGNAFSQAGFGYGWTQRAGHRSIPIRLRIDHVLVGPGLGIELSEVGSDIGSDHLPLITHINKAAVKQQTSWWNW